jgi:hypothetical protein
MAAASSNYRLDSLTPEQIASNACSTCPSIVHYGFNLGLYSNNNVSYPAYLVSRLDGSFAYQYLISFP